MRPPTAPRYAPPELIGVEHRLDSFDCGRPALDDFLRRHALKNEGKASRTYVVVARAGEQADSVVAYCSLAAGAVFHDEAPGRLARNMPNPIPVLLLGRLAVDRRHRGVGIGKHFLKESFLRAIEASARVGARALMVHAIDAEAAAFYRRHAPFQAFPVGGLTLFLPIETIAGLL